MWWESFFWELWKEDCWYSGCCAGRLKVSERSLFKLRPLWSGVYKFSAILDLLEFGNEIKFLPLWAVGLSRIVPSVFIYSSTNWFYFLNSFSYYRCVMILFFLARRGVIFLLAFKAIPLKAISCLVSVWLYEVFTDGNAWIVLGAIH